MLCGTINTHLWFLPPQPIMTFIITLFCQGFQLLFPVPQIFTFLSTSTTTSHLSCACWVELRWLNFIFVCVVSSVHCFFPFLTDSCSSFSVKFEVKDKDLESQESMMDLYERWMTHFGIFRVDPLEKWTRFEIFKETVKKNRAANIFADGRRRERCRSITGDHRHFFDSRKQSASGKVREEWHVFLYYQF